MPAGHILIKKKLISGRKSGDDGVHIIRYDQHLQVWNRSFLHQKKKPSGCCISIHCRQLDHLSLRLARMRPGCPLETSAAMMRFPTMGILPKMHRKNGQRLGDSGAFLMPMQKSEKKPWEVPPLNNWKLTATMVLGPCFVKWMQLLISHNQITLW